MFTFVFLCITIGLNILLSSEVLAQNTRNVTACLDGKNRITNYEADCQVTGSGITSRLIAVRSLYYGSKPTSANCVSNPRMECCSYNTTTDCLYKNNIHLSRVVDYCTGSSECSVHADHLSQFNEKCSYSSLFPKSSFYGIMEYDCIDTQKLVSICNQGIVKRKNKIYLNSNTFHGNQDKVNTTCSCRVSTICNNKIHVNAINIKLEKKYEDNRTLCYEELKFADGSDNQTRTVNCSERQLYGFAPLFTSSSNTLKIDLITQEKHDGIVWLEITGEDEDSELEVHCGVAVDLSIDNDYKCPEDKSDGVSLPPQVSSTARDNLQNVNRKPLQSDQSKLSTGVIIGVTIAVIFIIIIIVIILLLVFRARKTEEDRQHGYDRPTVFTVSSVDAYSSLHDIQNLQPAEYDNDSYVEPVDGLQQAHGILQPNHADEKINQCFDFASDDDDDDILDRKLKSLQCN